MKMGTVCSGIGAPEVAAGRLGWTCAWAFENDPFPSAVLAHRYPGVRNYGDLTRHEEHEIERVNIIVGGTPCQSFSVAGLRGGLGDARGNLALDYFKFIDRLRPRWVVWENVPGVLSSGGGRDFGAIVGALAELRYGWAYRILDAQHFGVPQRRRRVFLIGHSSGDWRRAAAVLFGSGSLRGDTPSRGKKRQGVAPTLSARTKGGGGLGTDFDLDGGVSDHPSSFWDGGQVSQTIDAVVAKRQTMPEKNRFPAVLVARETDSQIQRTAHTLRGVESDASEDGTGRGTPIISIQSVNIPREKQNGLGDSEAVAMYSLTARDQHAVAFSSKDYAADAGVLSPTLRAAGHNRSHANSGAPPAVCFEARFARNGRGASSSIVPPLKAQSEESGKGDGSPLVQSEMLVRRLTVTECLRLQGLPDGHTAIPWRGKSAEQCPDGPQYKAIGNSMAVPCIEWILRRIEIVQGIA